MLVTLYNDHLKWQSEGHIKCFVASPNPIAATISVMSEIEDGIMCSMAVF